MTKIEVLETVVSAFSAYNDYGNHRELLSTLVSGLDLVIAHDESGDYEADGYVVVTDGTKALRVDFHEDSYNGGQFDGCRWVSGKAKTITVWE